MDDRLVGRMLIWEPNLDLFEHGGGEAPPLGGLPGGIVEESLRNREATMRELLGEGTSFDPCCDHCLMFAKFGKVVTVDDHPAFIAPARYACTARGKEWEEEHALIIGRHHKQNLRGVVPGEIQKVL